MSIRSITCPGCSATLNVPATMTNIKCSACGTIWNVADPTAARKPAALKSAANRATGAADAPQKDSGADKGFSAGMMIGIAAAALILLILVGIGVAMMTGDVGGGGVDEATKPADAKTVKKTQPYEKAKIEFVEVNLPESQRKKIYHDFRLAAASTIDQKVFLPGNSKPRNTFDNTMGAIAKREVTHLSLIHNCEEKDIYNIIQEGDAKEWPPRKRSTLAAP